MRWLFDSMILLPVCASTPMAPKLVLSGVEATAPPASPNGQATAQREPLSNRGRLPEFTLSGAKGWRRYARHDRALHRHEWHARLDHSLLQGGTYEVKDGAAKKYYSIAGMMVAVNDGTAVQYLLTDHLGSTVAVTNSSGTLTSQQRYLPFGGARSIPNSPIAGTDFTYTGQRMLDSGMGGIMDYKARFYSPYLNRFLQPDTVIPDQTNPQSWNRYSYVENRPINFNDPSGHFAIVVAGVALPPLLVVASAVAIGVMVCNAFSDCHNAMVAGISNAVDTVVELAKRRPTKQEKIVEKIENTYNTSAENLLPTGNSPKCGFWCQFLIYSGIGTGILGCVSVFSEKCIDAFSKPSPKAVPTPTNFDIPYCPPSSNCPFEPLDSPLLLPPGTTINLPTSPATSTSTPTPTAPPIAPPVNTPAPGQRDRLHIPV